MQKKCGKCQTHRPLEEFYNNAANKDGLERRCIECCRAARRGPNGEPHSQLVLAKESAEVKWKNDLMALWREANKNG